MKTFKKTLALIVALVMAFAMCASAGVIEQKAAIATGPQAGVKANSKYIAVVDGSTYMNTVKSKIDIYKKTDAEPVYYCSVVKEIPDAEGTAYTIYQFDFMTGNVLCMTCYPGGPNLGSGNPQFAYIILDEAVQGTVNEATTMYYGQKGCYYIKRSDEVIWTRAMDGVYRFETFTPEWATYKSDTPGYSGQDYDFSFFEDTSYPWFHDKDNKQIKIYQYPENAAGDQRPGSEIAWLDLSSLPYDVHMIRGNEDYVVVNTSAYPTDGRGNNAIWYYDLSQPSSESNKLQPIMLSSTGEIVGTKGSRIKSMDIEGNLLAVCAQDAQRLNVYDLNTKACIYSGAISGQDTYGFEVTISDGEIITANSNGGIVLFGINRDLVMKIDPENYDYTVDENGKDVVATTVEITNGTSGLVSGNIFFASYEGNKLMGVSVKPIDVASGASESVTTGYVPVSKTATTTTFKAFYLSSDWAPLIDIPVEYSSFFGTSEKTDSYYEYIYRLTKAEIIPAKPDGIYVPDAEITKSEFVAMLVKAFKLTAPTGDTGFSDVPETAWYAEAAAAAKNAGLEEYSDKFMPDEIMTYEKAISMIKVLLPEAQITATGDTLDCKNAAKLIFKACEIQNRTSYYINPETGDDANDGTEEAPFKTLTKAKEAIAAVNEEMQNDLYVYMGGGDYFTYEPIKFTSADSGMNGFRIYYKNLPGEKPVMQAGVPVTGWEIHDAEKNIYKAPANGSKSRQLYVNGTRAVRARSEGGFTNAKFTSSGFECDNTELAEYKEIQNMEIAWKTKWMLQRGHVDSVSVGNGKCQVKMKKSFWENNQYNGGNGKITGTPAWYENAYELLDSPGEFYLSLRDDMFYYMPREGENINKIKAYSGTDTDIISIISDSITNPFKNVTFDGIEFRGTTWLYASEHGINDVQNSTNQNFTRAIYAERLENVDIINCCFENLGGEGIELVSGIKNVNIIGNRFYDISAHAIWVGEYTAIPSIRNLWDENIKISNNYIEKAGYEYMSAVPLVVGFLKDSEITQNEIFDVP